ncbi:MAG TPA: hypothetical protein VLB81_02535 [Gaiellales bacterium]|nr:hypothetical protein [Gaiellales bacterium]
MGLHRICSLVSAEVVIGGVAACRAWFGPWSGAPVTGGTGAVAVTVSTLDVAAMFQPLRRRIQHAVDRRLHRDRYDSARSVGSSTSACDQIDLGALETELLVVTTALQPASVGLWIRGDLPDQS